MRDMIDCDVSDFEDRYAGDKSVYAKFYNHPVLDQKATADAGRPKYKDVVYIEIRAAGNANNIIQRKASDLDIRRFQRQYDLFCRGQEEQLIGTPLTEVPWLSRSQVEELAYVRIRTLEALANVNDDVCQRMTGLRDLKNRAQHIIEASEKAAPITALEEENKGLKNKVDVLSVQVKELTAALKKMQKDE